MHSTCSDCQHINKTGVQRWEPVGLGKEFCVRVALVGGCLCITERGQSILFVRIIFTFQAVALKASKQISDKS